MRVSRLLASMASLAVAGAAIGVGWGPVAAQTEFCDPPNGIRIFDRTLDVWYGTLRIVRANGDLVSTADFVQLDKSVSAGLGSAIQGDAQVDPRVKTALPAWVTPLMTNIEWVVDPAGDAGGNAHQALLDRFAAAGDAAGAGGPANPGSPRHSPVRDYLLDNFDSPETAPISVGDTDAPEGCGQDGQTMTVDNRFEAEVTYHEQNATYTLAAQPAQQQGQGQAQRYAPAATIFGPCGDPRIHVRMDNSQSTLPAEFKIIYKHGAKDKRIVKRCGRPATMSE